MQQINASTREACPRFRARNWSKAQSIQSKGAPCREGRLDSCQHQTAAISVSKQRTVSKQWTEGPMKETRKRNCIEWMTERDNQAVHLWHIALPETKNTFFLENLHNSLQEGKNVSISDLICSPWPSAKPSVREAAIKSKQHHSHHNTTLPTVFITRSFFGSQQSK